MAELLPSNMSRTFLRKRRGKVRSIERETPERELDNKAFIVHAQQGQYPAAPIYGGN